MTDSLFSLTLAIFCACCISAQAGSCPPFYSSCREAYLIEQCSGKKPTNGEYDLQLVTKNGEKYFRRVFCDMESTVCGPEKGWMMVSELDMTQAGSKCPCGLDEGMYGNKRLCGNRGTGGCRSAIIGNTFGIPYTEVCGFVRGYQDKTPNAFRGKAANIEHTYLDGVSITYGKPRKHIWSYAAGAVSGFVGVLECPCNKGNPDTVPTFVKENWYCESGNPTNQALYQFFPNDVLWDGRNCTLLEELCCERGPNMPYFHTEVESATTETIEMRICHDEDFSNEDAPVEAYKIFVR